MRSLINGFTLFSPERFVPWEITEVQLTAIFDGLPLKHITTGYFVLDCEPFAGLQCSLGFHLHSAKVLTELEFFRNNYSNQKKSYDEFQLHLETAFGQPTHTEKEVTDSRVIFGWFTARGLSTTLLTDSDRKNTLESFNYDAVRRIHSR
jgi:hypothetical protein